LLAVSARHSAATERSAAGPRVAFSLGAHGDMPTEATKMEATNSQRTILLVDDEESVRNALRRTLKREGYNVIVANGPEEGLARLRENSIQLVISDHLMPNMTGLEFLTLVRDRHPDVCRIMLTGHADMDTAIRAINEGDIYRFLSKPWDDLELKVLLHVAFEHTELEAENRKLLAMVRRQADVMRAIDRQYPGIMSVMRDENGAIVISDQELAGLAMN
jgi:DNA-binding NtrC family response regulator